MNNKLKARILILLASNFACIYTQKPQTTTRPLTEANLRYIDNLVSQKPAPSLKTTPRTGIPDYIRAPQAEPKSWSESITSGFKTIGSGILTGLGISYVLTEKLLTSLWSGIQELPAALGKAYRLTVSTLSSAFKTAVELGAQAKEFVVKATTPYLKEIGAWLEQSAEWLSEKVTQAGQLAEQIADYSKKEIIDPAIKAAIPLALSGLEKFGQLMSKVGQLLVWAGSNLKAGAQNVWPYVVQLGNGIKALAEIGFDLLNQGYQTLFIPALKNLGDGLVYVANGFFDLASKAVDIGWTIITKTAAELREPLFKLLNGALNVLEDIAKFARQAFVALIKYRHIAYEKINALIVSSIKASVNFGSALLDMVIVLGNAAVEKGKPHAEWVWTNLTEFFWFSVELSKAIISFGSEVLGVIYEKSKPQIIASAQKLRDLLYQGYLKAQVLYKYAVESGTPWVIWSVNKAFAGYEYALEAGYDLMAAASEEYKSAQANVSKQLDEIMAKLQEWREDIAHMRQQLDAKIKDAKITLGFEVSQEAALAA